MHHRFIRLTAVAAAGALFVALVYGVLVAAGAAEPAETTVQGLTTRRLWASIVALLALIGVVSGSPALARPASRAMGRGATCAVGLGLLGLTNGVLNLALADGGPGTGNGVVGAAAAVVLGLAAVALGWLALTRSRRTALVSRT